MEKAWSLRRGGNLRREATAPGCKCGDTEKKRLNTAPAHSHAGGSFPATFISAHWSPSTPPSPTGDLGQEGRPRGSCIRRREGRRRAVFLLRGSGTQPGSPSPQNQCPSCAGLTRSGDSMMPALAALAGQLWRPASCKHALPGLGHNMCGLIRLCSLCSPRRNSD